MTDPRTYGLTDAAAVDALVDGRHGDPFALLGPHTVEGRRVVRALQPFRDESASLAPGTAAAAETNEFSRAAEVGAGTVRIRDWDGLAALAEFDPFYLQLDFAKTSG